MKDDLYWVWDTYLRRWMVVLVLEDEVYVLASFHSSPLEDNEGRFLFFTPARAPQHALKKKVRADMAF